MKKSKLLLVALILGALYVFYSAWYWLGGGVDSSNAGAAIATVLVAPHLFCTVMAVLFNALGYFMARRAFALTAGILYAVAMVLFPVYFFFVLIQMILCFVAFAKMSKASSVTA